MIPPRRSTRTAPAVLKRRAEYLGKMQLACEYTLEDVRSCLKQTPAVMSTKQCEEIWKQARIRELANHPLRTLHHYKEEMALCLAHENPEAHYVEGVKQYFALRNHRKGMYHLKISADNAYERGNYLFAILNLLTGNHAEGKRLLDLHGWKNDLTGVDKVWRQVKRSLMEVPIVKRKAYGVNLLALLPPRSCHQDDQDDRCNIFFYYKQVQKFLHLVSSG